MRFIALIGLAPIVRLVLTVAVPSFSGVTDEERVKSVDEEYKKLCREMAMELGARFTPVVSARMNVQLPRTHANWYECKVHDPMTQRPLDVSGQVYQRYQEAQEEKQSNDNAKAER